MTIRVRDYVLLRHPRRILRNLERLRVAGHIDAIPTLWQVFLGVVYMGHRIVFRPESIGETTDEAVRATFRARLLERKAIRGPFLVAERAIAPLDFTGFASTPSRIVRHLLGAFHPGDNFFYDLQCLAAHPGALDELERRTIAVIEGDTPRARWLRDLVVYEGYHERLLAAVRRAKTGDFDVRPDFRDNPDTSVTAFVRWCCAQPETPGATIEALRAGTLRFDPVVPR